jgi:glyoxylase-like metal-dependent hydrolase (beta-lactamase superfamily II)
MPVIRVVFHELPQAIIPSIIYEDDSEVKKPKLGKISDHVYVLDPDASTDRPALGAIIGKQATLMVDAGNSPAHAKLLLDELAKHDLTKLRYLVLTHWHWDHVFGSSVFDRPIFAHEETTRAIKEMARLDWSDEALDQRVEQGVEIEFCRDMIKAEWPDRSALQLKPPDVSFATCLEFDLGEVRCQVKHVGGDHASDSSILYIPEDRILFLGDCLYEDLNHGPQNYTIQKLYPLIEVIMSYEVNNYVWSHDAEPMPQKEMMEFVGLLKMIGDLVQQTGDNRELLLQNLRGILGFNLKNDHLEIADAFLCGLRGLQKK